MPAQQDTCPGCGAPLTVSTYDTVFRLPDQTELLYFAVPGGLCVLCNQLLVDPDLIDRLDLGDGRCVFAIENDTVLREPTST